MSGRVPSDRRTLVTALALLGVLGLAVVAAASNAPQTGRYVSVERVNGTPAEDPVAFEALGDRQQERFERALAADGPVRVDADTEAFEVADATYVAYRGAVYRVGVAVP